MYTQKLKILLILFISFSVEIFAQNQEQTLKLAKLQFDSENYEEAEYAFQRLLFFENDSNKLEIYQKLSDCYQIQKEYQKSIFYLDLASFCTNNDSLKSEFLFKKSYIYLLENKFDFALLELFKLSDSNSKYLTLKKNFYLGVVYFKKCDFENAELYFKNSMDSTQKTEIAKIDEIFAKKKRLNRPNPDVAANLNLFPGLGDIYSGSVKNAINSFLLSSSLLVLSVYVTASYSTLDAYLSVFPWSTRYYIGSMKLAKRTADKNREIKRQKIYGEIVEIIANSKSQ